MDLENDETLLVQSGKPVGVIRTHTHSPRVMIANSNLVGAWDNWDHFNELEKKGLMMYGQMTAGSWIYIGTQGILQGTYETFAALAERHYGSDLTGKIVLTGGLGGMGGAQPMSVTMAGGVAICVEVDPQRIQRRLDTQYLDVKTDRFDEAIRLAREAADAGKPLSIGLLGNCADVIPAIAADGRFPSRRGDRSDQCPRRAGRVRTPRHHPGRSPRPPEIRSGEVHRHVPGLHGECTAGPCST